MKRKAEKKPKDDAAQTHRVRAREAFIANLRQSGNVTEACRQAGVARCIAYEWRKLEEVFAKQWDDAMEEATDALEKEARRRAVDGVEEPVFRDVGVVGTVTRYSDRMLEILLKAHRPAKFREKVTLEHEIGEGLAKRLEGARRRVK